ncbi:MAG: mannonate dehydratase [Spirochaetales bacterium]|nr:mannonate dehydratase [Spirochaetales bacterium]
MKMIMRWFGEENDTVTLQQIRQVPNIDGIAGALHHVPAGEAWPMDEILALKKSINDAGLQFEVVESVNVSDAIKLGSPERDAHIDNYKKTISRLAEAGVKVICYNFMPVFDWTRSSLDAPLPDGSQTMEYNESVIAQIRPDTIADYMLEKAETYSLPGWEPERMAKIVELFSKFSLMTEEKLRENLKYFLDAIMPVCEETGVAMAMHPDDPPWSVFGLPRIFKNQRDMEAIMALNDSRMNGITLCTGCLGSHPDNDLPAMIESAVSKGKLYFVHIRNIRITKPRYFYEVSHFSGDGSLDMYAILKALYQSGFDGYARPDHGRMIWGEQARPGYGLYDRALGIAYINGIWEALQKG